MRTKEMSIFNKIGRIITVLAIVSVTSIIYFKKIK